MSAITVRLAQGVAACALALLAPLVSAQVLQNPYGMPIGLDDAKRAASAASAEAHKMGVSSVLAVTDPHGDLVYLERADGSQNGSVAVALAKARSAAIHKRATKVFEDQLASGGVNLRILALPGAVPIEGGVPLLIDGKIVGAIASSGGSPPQDGAIAKAGAEALAK
jgi:uncharacterized protein GlcG (DUF336 family)